ncbi:sodium-dependent transporter [Terribacillus saccharophilus]|uniref:sodium-dependent transporter n=1 Tax=Terribacillus saccharophilus TaxID=361277 RepID=UPI003D2CB0C7
MSQEHWKSKIGFILAAAGSAIGLGAIWKFPYIAGTGGGGAFFLIFLLFTVILGAPLLIGEFIIGRRTKLDAVSAYQKIAPGSLWTIIGRLGVVTCFILLSFYSVVGGWIIIYLFEAIRGSLNGLSQDGYGALFNDIISNPVPTLFAQFLFMLIAILVVAKGVQKGIEVTSKIMMPALFLLFVVLVIRSVSLDGSMEGIQFMLVPDFSNLTSESVLFALGQAFFTLSVGVSVMVTYASYLPKTQHLPQAAFSIIIINIFVALLAGLAIFPGVFAFGMEPDAGPVLIFAVLPAVFSNMQFGTLFFIIFLILFLFAALTSAFSMLEIFVAATTKKDKTKRTKRSWQLGLLIFLVGIPSCLSYGVLSDFLIFDKTIFDLFDYTVSNILMPLGALLISLFVPLKMKKSELFEELALGSNVGRGFFLVWYYLLKYVTPIAIIIVFLDVLGLWDFIFGLFS